MSNIYTGSIKVDSLDQYSDDDDALNERSFKQGAGFSSDQA